MKTMASHVKSSEFRSSVEAHEMMWFDESVEIPEAEMSGRRWPSPEFLAWRFAGDLIPSELYVPEERDYSFPALERMDEERRARMARGSIPGQAVGLEGSSAQCHRTRPTIGVRSLRSAPISMATCALKQRLESV